MFCPRCFRRIDDPAQRICELDGTRLSVAKRIDLVSSTATPEAGAVLGGRYVVRGLLGKGGMAHVYLAEDGITGEPVAVKVLDAEHAKDRATRQRFLREVEIGATIKHPGIVDVLDSGERADGAPYLVLECLFGESLGELLRREKKVSPAFGLPLVRQAASALGAAHRAGAVHRDVQLENLFLLGEHGKPYALKVVDFGFAKLQQGPRTAAGMAVGTVAFMAPEQILTDPVDARTDVYGLGIVMFRMFTGKLPFAMRDHAQVVAHHLFVPPPSPSTLEPGLDPRLEMLILRAISKRVANRQASMDEIVAHVDRILATPWDPRRELESSDTPRVEPDEYEPVGPFAKATIPSLRRQLERDKGTA